LSSILIAFALLPSTAWAQWPGPIRNCAVSGQNLYVRDVMQDLYYWSQFLPNVDPTRYASPEAYLEAVRYQPLDRTFSYVTSRAANDAFYSESQFIGFGLGVRYELINEGTDIRVRVAQVFGDSPALETGLSRGDDIVAVGGMSIRQWWESGRLGEMFGPTEIGYTSTILYKRAGADPVERAMTKRLVTIPTVSYAGVIDMDGRKIGYLFFRNFVTPSFAALDDAFTAFKAANVSELVLDLRYNGGGLVSVAQHLGSLIGGVRTNGQPFAEYFHNDRNAFRNRTIRFESKEQALTLDRLFVITTRSSASASELVINALRPFVPIITIGETTYGKPVGQYGIEFCDKVLAPVSFTLRNANGEGDFFDGFAPTCSAPDDLDHQLADVQEGSLAEVMFILRQGRCSRPPQPPPVATRRAQRLELDASGFQQLVGAH
jgi:C-terminal processing protease CtpA/Prc